MKKAEIYICSTFHGKYLYKGDSFEEEMLKEFEYILKDEDLRDDEMVLTIKEYLEKNKLSHPQDVLFNIFCDEVGLNPDFSQKLNLFDILHSECFVSNTKIGNALIQLCSSAELRFIVARKYYLDANTIKIEFESCNEDKDMDCHKALITQKSK